jgi:hypothetical protein
MPDTLTQDSHYVKPSEALWLGFDEADVASDALEMRWLGLVWIQEVDKIGVSVTVVDANANVVRLAVEHISKALDTGEAIQTAILGCN